MSLIKWHFHHKFAVAISKFLSGYLTFALRRNSTLMTLVDFLAQTRLLGKGPNIFNEVGTLRRTFQCCKNLLHHENCQLKLLNNFVYLFIYFFLPALQ